jgi:hypothetical protein
MNCSGAHLNESVAKPHRRSIETFAARSLLRCTHFRTQSWAFFDLALIARTKANPP